MTYSTILIHLRLGQSNARLLQLSADLVKRFDAGVIGVAVCQPMQVIYGDGYWVSGDLIDQDRADREREIDAAHGEFRQAFAGHAGFLDWQSAVTLESLAGHLSRAARAADLVITGVTSGALLDAAPQMSTGDLIMQLGRPVLIVPASAETLKLDHVMIGWKDTRESRRAAADALPMLKQAAQVTLVEIAPPDDLAAAQARLDQVAGWLHRHGIAAHVLAEPATGDDSTRFETLARDRRADLIVAGAYGHNRVREWVLGGVTRDLLLHGERCALLSH